MYVSIDGWSRMPSTINSVVILPKRTNVSFWFEASIVNLKDTIHFALVHYRYKQQSHQPCIVSKDHFIKKSLEPLESALWGQFTSRDPKLMTSYNPWKALCVASLPVEVQNG